MANATGPDHWRELTVPLLFEQAVEGWGDREFVISPGHSVTYSEMDRSVRGAAAELQQLGVQKGRRIAIVVEEKATFLRMWLASARTGALAVLINSRATPTELDTYLRIADVSAMVTDSVDLAERTTRRSEMAVMFAEAPRTVGRSVDESEPSTVNISGLDPVCAIFTSGSTARPKAVVHSHMSLALTGQAFASWMRLRTDDRLFLCLPLFHLNALAYTSMGAIASGAGLVLVEKFDPTAFWSDVVGNGVTQFNFIGAMISQLVDAERRPEEREHRVRVAYGIPALNRRAELEERFHLTFVSGYGMTETAFGLIESTDGERRQDSIGKPRAHPDPRFVTSARIVDQAGQDVQPGEVGELLLQSPAQMIGYLDNPEATADRVRDGWLWTGDLAKKDKDGFFYFVARDSGIIRHRGHNVAAHEVESTLLTLEGVRDAAVLGVPSLLYDQDVLAVVVPNSGVSLPPREVLEACQKKLSGFKVPRYVQVVANIPRTQTFKVDMRSLLQLVATSERWYDRSESGITDIPEMLRRFLTDPEGLPRTSASQE